MGCALKMEDFLFEKKYFSNSVSNGDISKVF
jgi:hypothetical protein